MKFTVPGFVNGTNREVEHLIFAFENARRRAYMMKRKGMDRLTILRRLNCETGIPARYVSLVLPDLLPPLWHIIFLL